MKYVAFKYRSSTCAMERDFRGITESSRCRCHHSPRYCNVRQQKVSVSKCEGTNSYHGDFIIRHDPAHISVQPGTTQIQDSDRGTSTTKVKQREDPPNAWRYAFSSQSISPDSYSCLPQTNLPIEQKHQRGTNAVCVRRFAPMIRT